ncbi:MAG: hypothetical protein CMJ58_09975 [Planctomycetaceae bacterium]|nr:hypothetical protein [Planctomycetaceae bacterium]
MKQLLTALIAAAIIWSATGSRSPAQPTTAHVDAWGQVQPPLPSVVRPSLDPDTGVINLDTLPMPPEQPVRVAGLVTDTAAGPVQVAPATPPSGLPPGTRAGLFQKVRFDATWLPALSDEPDALGASELNTAVVLGIPFFRPDTPLLITPAFSAFLLENSAALDLPDTLYEASVDFNHLRKFGDGPWAMNASVTVGYYSDFDQSSSKATRVTGRALAVYESSPAAKWILGVVYLNRAGASVLPAAGVIYTPRDDVRLDLIFPRPRLAWQLPGGTETDQQWWYVGGEFGGGAWSITHPSDGSLDFVNYRDLRALLGYERKIIGGLTRRFEVGYVFAREVEFDGPAPDTALDDTLFLRAGLAY